LLVDRSVRETAKRRRGGRGGLGTIPYIDNNPIRLRRPRQTYDFVKPYVGWSLHPGHDPESPYCGA